MIFETIVGYVYFVDLAHFIHASKMMELFKCTFPDHADIPQAYFQATQYHTRLKFVSQDSIRKLK